MLRRIAALLLACLLCPVVSFGETQITVTPIAQYSATKGLQMQRYANLVALRLEDEFYLMDASGNIVTEQGYYNIATYLSGYTHPYTECTIAPDEPLNRYGILDGTGKLITTDTYGTFFFLSDRWFVAQVLEPASGEQADYVDSRYIRSDIFHEGKLVASFDRAHYGSCAAFGDYLYMSKSSNGTDSTDMVIHASGACTEIEESGYYTYYEYNGWYSSDKGRWHSGSQQLAFVPECTLTKDEVDRWLCYDGNGHFIDLQGNIVASTDLLEGAYRSVVDVFCDKYIQVYHQGQYHLFDMQGNRIAQAANFAGGLDDGPKGEPMSLGYLLCEDAEGNLYYVDANGQNPTGFTCPREEIDYNCTNLSLPFLYSRDPDDDQYVVYTAAAGKLDTIYEGVLKDTASAACRLLGVKKDGKYGVIDLYGNTVIDFIYDDIIISLDGTLVAAKIWDGDHLHVFSAAYTEGPAACRSCGAARPSMDYRFCPLCGTPY